MADFFEWGRDDARQGRLYGDSLPNRSMPGDFIRATYRAGYSAQRGDLPAWIAQRGPRYYWIVALDNGRPVYNVTDGGSPKGGAGYHDLAELLRIKGDCHD